MVLKGSYEQREQATITAVRKYFTLGGCFTITENISLWEGVSNNREYFTLGGCCGPERLIRAERRENKLH